jgi:hypothetical protein
MLRREATVMSADTYFQQHLTKQLGFLVRSCKSYDEGHIDEGIRIATVIRVLVHDTKNCVSLLKHLGATSINLASTVANVDASRAVMFWGMGQFTMSQSNIAYRPNLDENSIKISLPAIMWWNQIVYVYGSLKLSRKTIVLGAADKDGGAHVDAKLTPEYAALTRSGAIGSLVYEAHNFHVTVPIENAHLGYIRQMGHEILRSPELNKLADSF